MAARTKYKLLPFDHKQIAERLFGQKPKVAGHAKPFAIFLYPRVGETTAMFVMLAFGGSFLVRCAGDDNGVAVTVQLHVF